jgi:transposase
VAKDNDSKTLFAAALALSPPWQVTGLHFDPEVGHRLDIDVDYPPLSQFPCPKCGAICPIHDSKMQQWRHLNFWQYLTFLRARQPRTKCRKDGVLTVPVPWARPGSDFTLLFEAMVVELARNGLVMAAISRMMGEHDTRLWRILEHYVHEARGRASFATTRHIGVDETSREKGHEYITVFADADESKVLFVTEGKDHTTVAAFKADLAEHGGEPARITEVCLDMSQAFVKGLREEFPSAHLTFDKFHVVMLMNDAVDEVRRKEQKEHVELKKTRYSWLKNEENLTAAEKERFQELKDSTLATARAYRIKTMLQALYDQPKERAPAFFKRWYFWATHSRLEPVVRVAKTLKGHLDGVMRWFDSGMTNGLLEGLNSLIQAAKAKARGFRSVEKMKVVIYVLLSKLDFRLPKAFPSMIHTK